MNPYAPDPWVVVEQRGRIGFLTLNRPKALNALSLDMIRDLTAALLRWRDDPQVLAVTIRGMGKGGAFGAFCAGGDIRFFHRAALAGDPMLEDFFTEEYALNHLIHTYPKPYIAFMDGIVMGGGMGISQGASLRLVTERSQLAMPETHIGLFPDVGGGYFLSRCPGHLGEYLGLTGRVVQGAQAIGAGLADALIDSARLPALWESLGHTPFQNGDAVERWCLTHEHKGAARSDWPMDKIDAVFALPTLDSILSALHTQPGEWARDTLAILSQRSPLMLHVVLAQIRRARVMGLADDLRMERNMVRHCFQPMHLGRSPATSETVEGIRALAIDKDHAPRWNPARPDEVTPAMIEGFFESPWPEHAHPLRHLG